MASTTNTQRAALFSLASLHVILCSGTAYGWTALRPVLLDAGLFAGASEISRARAMSWISTLGIAANATVFGRHGGLHTFSIDFVKAVVEARVAARPDVVFLFMNTAPFGAPPFFSPLFFPFFSLRSPRSPWRREASGPRTGNRSGAALHFLSEPRRP